MSNELNLSKRLAAEIAETLPLSDRPSVKRLKSTIGYSQKTKQPLIIVSSICPSYSVNENGRPDYNDLETGISANTRTHLNEVPKVVKILNGAKVKATHFFLMADTEVDLLPFLQNQLHLSTEEFTKRCSLTIQAISGELLKIYGKKRYVGTGIPPAARFLEYFGEKEWYSRYGYFEQLLLSQRQDPTSRVAVALARDFKGRSNIVEKLLGKVDQDTGEKHIARQKAQYMAFSSLMSEIFPGRLIVVNHRTPNFPWMNDFFRRDTDHKDRVGFEPKPESTQAVLKKMETNYPRRRLPLLELDISTMPND